MTLYGLKNYRLDESWLPWLKSGLRSDAYALDTSTVKIGNPLLSLLQFIKIVDSPDSNFVQSLNCLNCYEDFTRLKQSLLSNPEKCAIKEKVVQNSSEKKYFLLSQKAFQGLNHVIVSSNILLHAFEADIVISVTDPSTGGLTREINVEIDGGVHRANSRKMRFCEGRDRYLREQHGVEIVRVDLLAVQERKKTDKDILNWFQSLILVA
jgi:hypothetical protein